MMQAFDPDLTNFECKQLFDAISHENEHRVSGGEFVQSCLLKMKIVFDKHLRLAERRAKSTDSISWDIIPAVLQEAFRLPTRQIAAQVMETAWPNRGGSGLTFLAIMGEFRQLSCLSTAKKNTFCEEEREASAIPKLIDRAFRHLFEGNTEANCSCVNTEGNCLKVSVEAYEVRKTQK